MCVLHFEQCFIEFYTEYVQHHLKVKPGHIYVIVYHLIGMYGHYFGFVLIGAFAVKGAVFYVLYSIV